MWVLTDGENHRIKSIGMELSRTDWLTQTKKILNCSFSIFTTSPVQLCRQLKIVICKDQRVYCQCHTVKHNRVHQHRGQPHQFRLTNRKDSWVCQHRDRSSLSEEKDTCLSNTHRHTQTHKHTRMWQLPTGCFVTQMLEWITSKPRDMAGNVSPGLQNSGLLKYVVSFIDRGTVAEKYTTLQSFYTTV